jgi:hypothetical protein
MTNEFVKKLVAQAAANQADAEAALDAMLAAPTGPAGSEADQLEAEGDSSLQSRY